MSNADQTDWMVRWQRFITERGLPVENFVVSGVEICVFDLYRRVCSLGGLDSVIASKQMARIANDLGFQRGPDLRFYNTLCAFPSISHVWTVVWRQRLARGFERTVSAREFPRLTRIG